MDDEGKQLLQQMIREQRATGARHDRMQEQIDDNLRFLREVNRRAEIVLQDFLRSQQRMRAELRESTAQIRENTELTRAHTKAIYAVIDRLEGGGPAPAT